MIRLRFFNSLGEIVFDKDSWHLTEAEGFSIPAKMLTVARYTNQPGQTTTGCVANPRTITLSGDINLEKNGEEMPGIGSAILDADGFLEIETLRFKRIIGARCTELVFGERNGPYRSFVVQFLCDCPYFEDCEYTENVIYERVPMLSKDTQLPAVFSNRVSKGTINYPGSAYSEPIIEVSIPDGEGTLSVRNMSTGEMLSVRYDSSICSGLTIDVEKRTITDENGILRFELLTDDSFFDGFTLRSGDNRMEVINSNVKLDLFARIRYKVRYAEAVI